jgi:hypothetical protein
MNRFLAAKLPRRQFDDGARHQANENARSLEEQGSINPRGLLVRRPSSVGHDAAIVPSECRCIDAAQTRFQGDVSALVPRGIGAQAS